MITSEGRGSGKERTNYHKDHNEVDSLQNETGNGQATRCAANTDDGKNETEEPQNPVERRHPNKNNSEKSQYKTGYSHTI